ncbi:hypothetical protein [Mucilaginibacter sp. PPCGB 2223]|uniref:hypothetical protein n=1 Tax=Mucilaginibacter sp. PPCGB 2223 TaxID=1886027 RepID=UPI001112750C|nr:hypothetical protein [Mucilaginibacter sp. PPCGB 2223]
MTKNFTIRLIAGLAIIGCLYTINANASTGDTLSSSSGITIAVVLALIFIIGFKIVSTNLKKVDKDLEDNFGEKVLP